MRISIFLFTAVLSGCSTFGPAPENDSGLDVYIVSVKNHSEGVDATVAMQNFTQQKMRLNKGNSVTLLLDGNYRVKGRINEVVDIAPGKKANANLKFHFINEPKIYKTGLIEITPFKVFKTCSQAEADPYVVQESREVASSADIEPDTCNRPLKKPIRLLLTGSK